MPSTIQLSSFLHPWSNTRQIARFKVLGRRKNKGDRGSFGVAPEQRHNSHQRHLQAATRLVCHRKHGNNELAEGPAAKRRRSSP
jgi:hypothetical protein